MNVSRLEKLYRLMRRRNLDWLALVPGANLFYLTGLSFHLGDRPTVAFFHPDRRPALVLPELEIRKADGLDIELFPWRDKVGFMDAFKQAATVLNLSGARLGVEAYTMRLVEVDILNAIIGSGLLLPADNVVATLRMLKDADEIERMRRAVDLAQLAINDTLAQFRPGMTERQIEACLKIAILKAGSENVSFDPIVASGPNTANPHASPTDRPIRSGDFLLFDWGVYVDGYASDITRTFPVGEMEPEMRVIYDLVKEANAAGKAAVRPGATCEEVDAAARHVIEKAGYGDDFFHRTGHGLGLQVHEAPFIVAGNERVLEPGMTFTIEPGIYLAGRNGVRIEDDVVVTEQGCESLTTFPREWRPIG